MKYLVEFTEKALVKRIVQCEVEAESEEDARYYCNDRDCRVDPYEPECNY